MKLNILTNSSKKEKKKSQKKKKINPIKREIDYSKPFYKDVNFSRKRDFYVELNKENRGYTPNLSLNKTYKVIKTLITEHEDYLIKSLIINNNLGNNESYLAHNFIEVKNEN